MLLPVINVPGMKSRKKPLTAKELAVCERLRNIWDAKRGELDLSQENAAEVLKISQGAVSHYLNGRNALGFEAIFRWADLLRVHPYQLDPEFSTRLPQSLKLVVDLMSAAKGSGTGEISIKDISHIYDVDRPSALVIHEGKR